MRICKNAFVVVTTLSCALVVLAQTETKAKPKLTLDEFFNSVSFPALEISPDGNSVVIVTERADWDQKIFRKDLWLYRDDAKGGALIQLTQSGHDSGPKWSPDGRWIAFLSERKTSAEKGGDNDSDSDSPDKDDEANQLYLISPNGGEAFAVTEGEEGVHAFSWSPDSQTIYFATRQPWSKQQKDDYKEEWKDVEQYRTAERGDTIFALDLGSALARHNAMAAKVTPDSEKEKKNKEDVTPGAQAIATTPLRVDALLMSPTGNKLAFLTNAINQRQEKVEDVEIYAVDLPSVARAPSPATAGSDTKPSPTLTVPRRITHNQAVEIHPHWANDSRHIFFSVEVGDVSGPYRDLQPHLYWVDTENGAIEQWSKDFIGPVERYAVAGDVGADAFVRPASAASAPRTNASGATLLISARAGTEVQMYSVNKPSESLRRISGWAGTYSDISVSPHSPRVAFVYSSLGKPEEVYLADGSGKLDEARAITSFNKLFTERDLPQGKPYKWKADDGTMVEGMLVYPPGKFEAKHLPMLTFIHGGPADADGNHFEADWYQWARARRHQRMARLRAQLSRFHRLRRQVPHADRSANRIASGQGHSRRCRRAGERWHRRSRPPHPRRLQLRRIHDQLADHPDHALQSRSHGRGLGGARWQLGQRRHDV